MVENEKVRECFIYYNRFKNVMTQIITKKRILPVENTNEDTNSFSEYEYEGKNLIRDVINLYIGGEVSYCFLQSIASEEGARMTAMDDATKNAGELEEKLRLKFNRLRQTNITTELIEIISGAEAI